MNIIPRSRVVAAFFAAFLSIQLAPAAVTTWSGASGLNWSTGGNWDTLLAPGAADDTRFLNTGTGTTTVMDLTRAVNSLTYGQDNSGLHTTIISPAQTLTVSGAAAADVLYVGTAIAVGNNTLTPATIQGSSLTLNGTGNLVVRQGHANTGTHRATLDLSGLDTLNATIGRLLVGQANAGAAINRPTGTLLLAKTNHITLNGAAPQVMVQDSGSNANGSTDSVLTFGQVTTLFGDTMRMGGQKGNGTINFNPAFTAPSLQLRNADGSSRISLLTCGDNSFANSGNNTVALMDLSLGVVDALVETNFVGRGNPGPSLGTANGTLNVGAGTFDVNVLEIAYQIATGASGAVNGTLNLNDNFLLPGGPTLAVNSMLRLARTNGSTAAVNGTLNVTGGKVFANSIVAGGGNSVLSLTSSTLAVTNAAGTLAAPIRALTLNDTTLLIPALNSGAVIVVSNLTVGGVQNLIKVTSIPPISSYPATFPLIAYQTGAGGNFALGPLPSAAPSYSGTLVDTGNGVVSLQLTAGPVVDLSLRWTGATDSTWDSFTVNWLYQGNPSAFFAGSAALFNDNTAQPNVSLTEALSPGSITVSNNTVAYTFTGSGNIAGAGSLIKRGSAGLTLANQGINNISAVTIAAGTLQLGSGGTDGSLSAVSITNNGALVVNRSGSLALSSAISGTGTLTKSGDGLLVLSGANTYTGATVLSGGSLQVDGSSGNGALTSSAGTVLAGSGTINGAVTVGGKLNPGPLSGPGIFKAHGGLVLAAGSTLAFDLSATDPSNPAVNDSVEVLGNLSLNNNAITINISGTPQLGSSYLLFTYSGALSGSFNPTINGTHFPVALDTSIAGSVYLNVTGDAGLALKWNSVSDPAWDSIATNWLNLNNSSPAVFFAGDSVLLDDTSGVVTTISIGSGVSVFPSVITNDSAANNFTISGPGRISGSASIVKTNVGTLALASANNFTGTVDIEAGVLRTDSDTALGAVSGGTIVHDGATLDLNGRNLGGEPITVSGAGVNGQGAIVSGGAAQFQAVRQITLAGHTTFGGSGLWGINNGGGAASLNTGGNAYNLTKVGANTINFAQLTTVDFALADIDIQEGTIEFSGLTSSMGDPARTNFVRSGATVSFANGTVSWNKQFVFFGDGTANTVNVGTGGNADLAGPLTLQGDCVFNVGGVSLTVSGVIGGNGGVTKTGGSPMILTNANPYTGDTRINVGALRLNGIGSISASSNVVIAAGATLSVTGRVDSTMTLAGGQTLKGNGAINGTLIAGAGSTVAPGLDAVGMLTVSNAVTLSGTNVMELDQASGTNDVLRSNSSITYGGTLRLVNLGGPLTNGSSFKLFSASSYLGSFAALQPATPGAGQTWDTSALNTGILKVAGSAGPHLDFSVVGGSLVFNWPDGFKLVWQTNNTGLSNNWVPYPNQSKPVSVTINPAFRTAFFGLQPQ